MKKRPLHNVSGTLPVWREKMCVLVWEAESEGGKARTIDAAHITLFFSLRLVTDIRTMERDKQSLRVLGIGAHNGHICNIQLCESLLRTKKPIWQRSQGVAHEAPA